MRVLFALPGLHRFDRGAEIAFIAIAKELAKAGDTVTLIGSGQTRVHAPYRFLHAASRSRKKFESFPKFPVFRSEFVYEELSFVGPLLCQYRPSEYDVTVTCSYPFTNWALRCTPSRARPPHVFVTQNGDWPAYSNDAEFRFFGCDGLVCTNPDFYERNKARWRSRMIPNGVDCDHFRPGTPQRAEFGLPPDRLIVLMVSALSPSKRIEVGIEAVSQLADAHLVVAGDGPLGETLDVLGSNRMPGRFTRLSVHPERMPALYQSADVFLHLAKEESFGNVFVEAMACGLPIVAHDSARLRWIVGDDQFLHDTADTTAIAQNIALARQAPVTEREARAKRVARFSWSKIGETYRDFFEEIVKRARPT